MTNAPLVFKNDNDHLEWHKQREYIIAMDGIDETSRKKLVDAYVVLEHELGKGFLKTSSYDHPIRQMISNRTDWQIQELIKFVETLLILKQSDSGYPRLKKLLLPNVKAKLEGVPFIEIAQEYIKAGFRVSFPNDINSDKSPDLEIINPENNNRFFIEVSAIDESDKRTIRTDNYRFLRSQFYARPLRIDCFCRQKEVIEKDYYSEFEKIISHSKLKVIQLGQTIYYSDKYLEFLIITKDKSDELTEVCKTNNLRRFDVEGMNLNFDETDRLTNHKIKKEAIQILPEFNGLLYFPCSFLFFLTADMNNTITSLEDYLSKFKNIIGIVFFAKYADGFGEEKFQKTGKHIFSRKVNKALCSEFLFIYNDSCEVKISGKTIEKIYKTFS